MVTLQLTYLPQFNILQADNDAIANLTSNPSNYASVEMTATLTCGTAIVKAYATGDLYDTTKEFYYFENSIWITPLMFGLVIPTDGSSGFIDGVYSVTIKIIDSSNGYTIYSNCIFIDITYKCQVAGLLDNIIAENQKGGEQTATIAHILHYSLVNGSNCGCNCAAMCENFNSLCSLLGNASAQINNDCGCW